MNSQQTQSYIREVSTQVAMALASGETPDAVKDCLKTIISEASTEADLTVADFSSIGESLPNVIEKLPTDYGRGSLSSIAAIVRHDTGAFQEFYKQRLDKEPIRTATAEPKQTTENDMKDENKLNRAEVITHEEIELLIYSLAHEAEFQPFAIYGLMFLFGSIKKSLEAGYTSEIENICLSLLKLYSLSENGYKAIDRVTKNIQVHYRAADFKSDDYRAVIKPFVEGERAEVIEKLLPKIVDSPAQSSEPENESKSLNALANQFAAIMNNPNLPTDIYNLLTDEFCQVKDVTNTPENILLNLKSLRKAERKQREAKNA